MSKMDEKIKCYNFVYRAIKKKTLYFLNDSPVCKVYDEANSDLIIYYSKH